MSAARATARSLCRPRGGILHGHRQPAAASPSRWLRRTGSSATRHARAVFLPGRSGRRLASVHSDEDRMTLAFAGLLAGFVHVLSGPDHLAAIAPYAVDGKSRAWRTGVRWGLGHTTGALAVGLLMLAVRDALPLDAMSAWGERLVGLALLGIGIWGLGAALTRTTPAVARSRISRPRACGIRGRYAPRPRRQRPSARHPAGARPALGLSRRDRIFSSSVQAASPRWARSPRSSAGSQAGRARAAPRAQGALLGLSSVVAVVVGGFWLLGACDPCRTCSQFVRMLRRHRDRRRTGGRARRHPCGGAGRAHGTGDRRGVRRHGRQRRTRPGADVGICRAADARRATTAAVRHHHERTRVAVTTGCWRACARSCTT